MNPDERLAWLKERQTGLGATDVAAIAGVGFRTPEEVYTEKTSDLVTDAPPSPLQMMGLALEPINAALYHQRTGRTLIAPGLIRSPADPWVLATLDRATTDAGADYGRPVELKYTAFYGDDWGVEGTDEIPDGYVVQLLWQQIVLRERGHLVERGDLSAIDARGSHRVYTVPFDANLADLLFDLAASFWGRVKSRSGIDGWQHSARAAIAERLDRIRPDTEVVLDDHAADLVRAYQAHKAAEKQAEEAANAAKAALLVHLGDYETGRLPDGTRVRQRKVERKAYTVEAGSYLRFDVLRPKKAKV